MIDAFPEYAITSSPEVEFDAEAPTTEQLRQIRMLVELVESQRPSPLGPEDDRHGKSVTATWVDPPEYGSGRYRQGLEYVPREGTDGLYPAMVSRSSVQSLHMYVLFEGTVWYQDETMPAACFAGSAGACKMAEGLQFVVDSMRMSPKHCCVDGQPLERQTSTLAV